jgi:hypothetical protein
MELDRTVESSRTKSDLACSQLSTVVQLDKKEMNDDIKYAKHMQWETLVIKKKKIKKNTKVGKLFT